MLPNAAGSLTISSYPASLLLCVSFKCDGFGCFPELDGDLRKRCLLDVSFFITFPRVVCESSAITTEDDTDDTISLRVVFKLDLGITHSSPRAAITKRRNPIRPFRNFIVFCVDVIVVVHPMRASCIRVFVEK